MYHHYHGNSDLLSSRPAFYPDRHLLMQGDNIQGDSGLMLSTDAKPRLKWTTELHGRFIEAVNQLGGPDKATPKTVMRLMGIPGLTLYHLKSHLQKYRLSKNLQVQSSTRTPNDVLGCVSADKTTGVDESLNANTNVKVETSKNLQINEALQMQIEVQRQLNEQLEVQRRLQLQIEAQGKYLQSVLEKAQETLGMQNLGSPGLEIAKVQLSELVSKVSSECLSTEFLDMPGTPRSCIRHKRTIQKADCTMDSCLTSCEVSQYNRALHDTSRRLITYAGSSSHCAGQTHEDMKPEYAELSSNEYSTWSSSIFPIQRNSSFLSINFRKERLIEGNGMDLEERQNDKDRNYTYLEQPSSKRLEVRHDEVKQLNADGQTSIKAPLDLNIHDNNDSVSGCKQLDLNRFNLD